MSTAIINLASDVLITGIANGDFLVWSSSLGKWINSSSPGTSVTLAAVSGVPAAELQTIDPSQKVTYFDDFLAAALEARNSSTAGAGTATAALTKVTNSVSGEATIKSASDDGTNAQNSSNLTLDELNFKAGQGGLAFECRIKIDAITAVGLFVGFTDTISTTVEMPVFLNGVDIDSDATDACGVGFDTDGTTAQFYHGGVKADVDTVPAYSGTAPVAATYVTLRVEVSASGSVTGYVNGTAIGAAVANAVTTTVALTPCIVITNRGAAQRIATVDYWWCQQSR